MKTLHSLKYMLYIYFEEVHVLQKIEKKGDLLILVLIFKSLGVYLLCKELLIYWWWQQQFQT